ncbi:hypothetical protein [Acinetobacter baumannii]|uniref:hypothetical protein n=1 Tax=Acinetobacter baumannii TaxID=470 RepID=UPI00321B9B21
MGIDFNFFEKLREIITPTYNQALNAKRSERLNKFFEDRTRIKSLNESEKVKQILLNNAAATLSGVKNAKYEELEYFLETSDTDDFEMKYWAFAWNRAGFVVSRDESGKIIGIHSTPGKKVKITIMNLFLMLSMCIWPFLLNFEREPFLNLGLTENMWNIFILIAIGFCFVTIIKILYDWSHWHDLNVILGRQQQQ